MKAAIYPGTFDPPTLGHLNIIHRAASKFEKLVIAIGKNTTKTSTAFTLEERVQLLKIITANISNVEVAVFNGLLVDFANSLGISIMIRAIRNILDFEIETLQAKVNLQLGGVDTFYLAVNENCRLISSSLVREIASYGKRLHDFVPPEIEEVIFKHLTKKDLNSS